MSHPLNEVGMRVCVKLLNAIESIAEENGDSGQMNDVLFGLVEAYNDLTGVLSMVSGIDAAKVTRDTINTELELKRAWLHSVTEPRLYLVKGSV